MLKENVDLLTNIIFLYRAKIVAFKWFFTYKDFLYNSCNIE